MMPEANSTQLRPPSRAKSLTCPACGGVAVKSFDIEDDPMPGLTRTECCCANRHLWSIRWAAA